jgi:hypothetical protein
VEQVSVTVERVGEPGRWVRVTMGLHACLPGPDWLDWQDPLTFDLSPADQLSAALGWRDWAEEVQRAIEYVWRPYPAGRVELRAVRGVLGAEDRSGLALACTLALRRLLGEMAPELPTAQWRLRE